MVASKLNSRTARRLVDLKVSRHESLSGARFGGGVHSLSRLRQIAVASGVDNELLHRQMLDHGLTPQNFVALRYAPVAEVAWASGYVTNAEYVLAIKPMFSADLFKSPQATEKFRAWLKRRPTDGLWSLWEEYAYARRSEHHAAGDKEFGRRMHELATDVALASGGLLDEGDICHAERAVLDRIAAVYGLRGARRTNLSG